MFNSEVYLLVTVGKRRAGSMIGFGILVGGGCLAKDVVSGQKNKKNGEHVLEEPGSASCT
jgi:hypothetical protein